MLAAVLLAGMALLSVACSGNDGSDGRQDGTQAAPQPVSFDVYVNRNTTRGGATGMINDLATLKTAGFGVFAYYTDNHLYNQLALPNFMYNQQVVWASSSWTYSPVKYWPNETGPDAQSEDTDYLTFFAYAPYAAVDAVTGRADTDPAETAPPSGITALTRAKDSGDPLVRYCASLDPTKAVDLCWATPHLDQQKPAIDYKVNFAFQHALAALNVQIDADIDVVSHATSTLDGSTRIWVRSITFEGFATKGQLNLNDGKWYGLDCDCDLTSKPVTIYDGRRDGHEGVSASLNETPTGLNPDIVQFYSYDDLNLGTYEWEAKYPSSTKPTGVTNTPVNLFNPTEVSGDAATLRAAPVFVLPTNDPLKVTIEYDVETCDPKLKSDFLADGKTPGSRIKNILTAAISPAIRIVAGKKYTINLHLGMTSVKASATIETWKVGDSASVDVPNS